MPTLPGAARDYARRAVPGGARPRTVHLCQRGEMRAAPGDRWRPLASEQEIGVREPGFVWLARTQLGPLLPARVLDAYVGGEGLLEARLFGSLPVARMMGPQISKSELMRYLAELPWVPYAMLHNTHLRWRELDAATVEVSADTADGPARVRLVFEGGDIVRAEADDRPRAVGERTVPTRWRGVFSRYRTMADGCRIPTWAEVSWVLDNGPFACWRGEITAYEAR